MPSRSPTIREAGTTAFDEQVLRRFLAAAAIAFALGVNALPGSAGGGDRMAPPSEQGSVAAAGGGGPDPHPGAGRSRR